MIPPASEMRKLRLCGLATVTLEAGGHLTAMPELSAPRWHQATGKGLAQRPARLRSGLGCCSVVVSQGWKFKYGKEDLGKQQG